MKELTLFLFVIFGSTFSTYSNSKTAYLFECNNCSMQQMGQLVSNSVQYNNLPLSYDFYVYGLDPFASQRFGVEHDINLYLTYPLPSDPQLQNLFDALKNLSESNGNSLEFEVNLTQGVGFVGVYDYLHNPSIQVQASNQVHNSLTGFQAAFFDIIRNFSLPILNFERRITARLQFDDGTVIVRYDYDTQVFEPIPGSARDTSGNIIPLTHSDFASGGYRQYYFQGPGAPKI